MSTRLQPHTDDATRRRSPWRRTLVDVERGMTQGFRGGSSLFAHCFATGVVVVAGFVIGLEVLEWVAIVLALTFVLTAEMFNQVLNVIWENIGHHFPQAARTSQRVGTAAVFIAITGAVLTVGLIFGQHLSHVTPV
jgi:diacylglycerol kinase